MRVFVYIGEEGTEAYGLRFPFNEPVEVSDEFVIRKLSGNRFFREVAVEQVIELPPGEYIASGAGIVPIKRKPGRPRKDA